MSESKQAILIVDDDRSILRVFTRVLEKEGYAVTAVSSGKDAIAQIKHAHFDAALIDVRLPDMEGTELLPVINNYSPKTVRIVFTGSPEIDSLKNGSRKLMDAFLVKPVRPEVILEVLEQKLKQRND